MHAYIYSLDNRKYGLVQTGLPWPATTALLTLCVCSYACFLLLLMTIYGMSALTKLEHPHTQYRLKSIPNRVLTPHAEWLSGVKLYRLCSMHVKDCGGWWLSGCHISMVEQWCPEFNSWWLLSFSLSYLMTSKSLYFGQEAMEIRDVPSMTMYKICTYCSWFLKVCPLVNEL